jgi:hypothetical protein
MKVGMAAAGLLVVVAASAVGAALASGCGGSGGGSSGGGGDPPSCGNPGQPPCATGGATTLATQHNYAIHHLFLGDLDPATGQPSPTAWQNFGYDLDGKTTTASSIDVCRQSKTALAKEQVDGPNGIDNSFGENLLPIIVQLDPSASASVNASINQGKFTIMTDVTGFDDSAGNMTTATGLSGVILAGADVSGTGAPTWTPSFTWAVRPELLDCAPTCQGVMDPAAHSTIKMMGSYQAGGTFVSGAPTQIDIALSIAGTTIQLNILSAVVTFQPKSPGRVGHGGQRRHRLERRGHALQRDHHRPRVRRGRNRPADDDCGALDGRNEPLRHGRRDGLRSTQGGGRVRARASSYSTGRRRTRTRARARTRPSVLAIGPSIVRNRPHETIVVRRSPAD